MHGAPEHGRWLGRGLCPEGHSHCGKPLGLSRLWRPHLRRVAQAERARWQAGGGAHKAASRAQQRRRGDRLVGGGGGGDDLREGEDGAHARDAPLGRKQLGGGGPRDLQRGQRDKPRQSSAEPRPSGDGKQREHADEARQPDQAAVAAGAREEGGDRESDGDL